MLVLRNSRRLPPLLRVVHFVAVLLLLAASALAIAVIATGMLSSSQSLPDASHSLLTVLIVANLGLVGWACASVVSTYRVRFRQPAGEPMPFPLSSWQSQVRMLALLAALPTSALVLVLILPLASPAFFLAAGITPLALFVLCVADLRRMGYAARNRLMQVPRTP